MAERLLIVEDESTLRESLQRVFIREGYEVDTAGSVEEALEGFEEGAYDLIVTDILLPGRNGIEFLKEVKKQVVDQLVIVMTAYASIETAIGALRAGAYDYILKPIIHEEIKRIIRNALNVRSLRVENLILKKQIERLYDFEKIIGESQVIKDLIDQVKKISDSKTNILILGETGTGKELFTRAIHFNSSRRNNPFIPINCSAIPENLLESEFFGHVKGAFHRGHAVQKGPF